jgi:hypothetical protein
MCKCVLPPGANATEVDKYIDTKFIKLEDVKEECDEGTRLEGIRK